MNPKNSMDLLICIKSLVTKRIASSVLVQENILQILFELLLNYRDEEDSNYKSVLAQNAPYLNLPKLALTIEIIKMIFESGFFREGDDGNHYSNIVLELNLNAFVRFLEMVCLDKKHILRSFRSQLILNLCETSVCTWLTKILDSIQQLIEIMKRIFANAHKNKEVGTLEDIERS